MNNIVPEHKYEYHRGAGETGHPTIIIFIGLSLVIGGLFFHWWLDQGKAWVLEHWHESYGTLQFTFVLLTTIGVILVLIGLTRYGMPVILAIIQAHRENHEVEREKAQLLLEAQVIHYAITERLNIEYRNAKAINPPRDVIQEYALTEEHDTLPQQLRAPAEEYIHLSDDFKPHVDEGVASGRITIFGVSGSGKSNSFAVVAEELGRLEVPLLIGDTEGEYEELARPPYLPHAQIVGPTSITVIDAVDFGYNLLEERLQVLLQMAEYPDEEAAKVFIGIVGGMWKWEEERPNAERLMCMVMLDEAAKWLPQDNTDSYLTKETQAAFFNCISSGVVERGRKRGVGLTLANQRVARLKKNVLQPSLALFHRQTQDVDIQRYAEMGIKRDEVLSLGNGDAYVFTDRVAKRRIHMRLRRSPHGANTPGIGSIRGRSYGRVTERLEEDQYQPVEQVHANTVTLSQDGIPPNSAPNWAENEAVPEQWRKKIWVLCEQGMARHKIQAELGLSGDQWWMIQTVADEYKRSKAMKGA